MNPSFSFLVIECEQVLSPFSLNYCFYEKITKDVQFAHEYSWELYN